MKDSAIRRVRVRETLFGADTFLYCISLAKETEKALLAEAAAGKATRPDLFEWRADFMDVYPNLEAMVEISKALRQAVGDMPIIFTARHGEEDGKKAIPDGAKFALVRAVADAGTVDIVDMELRYGAERLRQWAALLHEKGVKLLVSDHHLGRKVPVHQIPALLLAEQACDADIAKLVVYMPDFDTLAEFGDAVGAARDQGFHLPLIAGGDGEMAVAARLAGEGIGSNMTFVTGGGAGSHPSQVGIAQLRKLRTRMGLQ